jgi:hypothetical protein
MKTDLEDTEIDSETEISIDERFDILSNQRRRYILYYLKQNGGQASLGELAEQIAAWENNISIKNITYKERKRVYTSLQQVHLPRMDRKGVVNFDDQAGLVSVGPAASELKVYLEIVGDDDIPWSVFYFVLALLNVVVIGLLSMMGNINGYIGGTEVAVFCVTSFLMVSLVHIYLSRKEMRLENESEYSELTD